MFPPGALGENQGIIADLQMYARCLKAAVYDQAGDVNGAAGDEATEHSIFCNDDVRDPVQYPPCSHQGGDHRDYGGCTQVIIPRLTCHNLSATKSGLMAMTFHHARSSPS
jgi:hypothetical protein